MKRRSLHIVVVVVACLAFASGCATWKDLWVGHAAEYRADFERRKAAILAAGNASEEADAMREMGRWLKESPYGYTLSMAPQAGSNGIDVTKVKPGESVEFWLHARSDYEPRPGGFSIVPKDPANLLLLEGK